MNTCAVAFRREMLADLRTLRDNFDKYGDITSNGSSRKYLIDRYSKAIKMSSSLEERVEEFEDLIATENDVLFSAVRKELSHKFKATIMKADGGEFTAEYALVDVKKVEDGTQLVMASIGTDGSVTDEKFSYTFMPGQDASVVAKSGSSISRIPKISRVLGDANTLLHNAVWRSKREEQVRTGREQIEQLKKILRSGDVTGIVDYSRATKKAGYEHGNVEHMKKMLEDLYVFSGDKVDETYIENMKNLLDGMHPHFFRKVDLFIEETNKDTFGQVDFDGSMLISMNPKRKVGKSAAEVYMHEVVHTMTMFALRQGSVQADGIRRQLNYAFAKALEKTKWQDLLEVAESKASKGQIEAAKEMYEYIFKSENSRDEFLAHALTNPVFMKHLASIRMREAEGKDMSMVQKVVGMFYRLMDRVLGNYLFLSGDKTVSAQVHSLAYQLAKINQDSDVEVHNGSMLAKMNNAVNEIDEKMHNSIAGFMEKHFDPNDVLTPLSANASRLEEVAFYGKFFGKALVNKNYRDHVGLLVSSWGLGPRSTLREIVSGIYEPSEIEMAAQWAGLRANTVDTTRNSVITTTKRAVMNAFSRRLEDNESEAITEVMLETNLTEMMKSGSQYKKNYSDKDVIAMLEDKDTLGKKFDEARKKLISIANETGRKADAIWLLNQAKGLGFFMATGQGHVKQLTNADSIAIGYLTNNRHSPDRVLIEAINEVATLTALTYTKEGKKQMAAELMRTEKVGVDAVVSTYEAFKKDSRNKLFDNDKYHIITGYVKEILDDTIDVVTAKIANKEDMEKAGYKLVSRMAPMNGEVRSEPVGMFVSNEYGKAERLRGAVGLGDNKARGTSLKDIKYVESNSLGNTYFKSDMIRVGNTAVKLGERMHKEEITNFDDIEMGMMPILGKGGKVVDYRVMMNKDAKKDMLGQNKRVDDVLARSMGSVADKELRKQHNKEVLDVIKEGMGKENWVEGPIGVDRVTEYALIGPSATDREMKELYYMLPQEYRDFIDSRTDKTMAVPKALVDIYFGYRHPQIGNMFNKALPKWMRNILNTFEAFWIDLVKIAKTNILLKMPQILIGNIISNALLMINTGIGPIELWNMHKESFGSVREYMKTHKEMLELELDIKRSEATFNRNFDSGLDYDIAQDEALLKNRNDDKVATRLKKNRVKKKREELLKNRIEKNKEVLAEKMKILEKNSINELVQAGLYQSVVEDVETAQLGDSNKITETLDNVLRKAPGAIRTPLQILYLSKETKWYQVNQEVLQMSDLIARDIMNKRQKRVDELVANGEKDIPREIREIMDIKDERKVLKGVEREKFMELAKKSRMNNLLSYFINYNKPSGKTEEYMNRIGLLMFTKYFKRIQRVVFGVGARHPVRSLLLLTAAAFAIDAEMIQDQSFLTKGFGGFDGEFGLTNMVPVYGPLDHIMNVVQPALLKDDLPWGFIR